MNAGSSRAPARARVRGRIAGAVVCLAGACALQGCAGHGKYTSEHLDQATEKMALLKSGTEWQTAHQQFLAGEMDKALKSIDKSIALNPKVSKSHVLRGRILIERGELEAAKRALLEGERLDESSADAQYFLGIVEERSSRYEDALARYRRAAELDETSPQYVVAWSEMLVHLGRLDEAGSLLESQSEQFRHSAAIRQSLGHLATLRGDHQRAIELLNEARLLAPDDGAITEDLARAHLAVGNYAQGEPLLARALEMSKDHRRRDLLRLRATCLVKLGRPVEARAILTDLTGDKEGATDARSWVDLGNVSALLDDRPRLKAASARLIALAPNRHEGHLFRAIFLKRSGDLHGAKEAAGYAMRLAPPGDTSPLLLHALICQDLGDENDARDSLAAVLAIDPGNEPARRLLASMQGGNAVAGHPDAMHP